MEQSSATRMNLLARKNQVELATQGCSLLRGKRDALFKELLKIVKPLASHHAKLYRQLRKAGLSLTLAKAFNGKLYLKSLALTSNQTINLEQEETKFWGVRLPEFLFNYIKKDITNYGVAVSGLTSSAVETASDFENILEKLLEIASLEIRLKRIGIEARKTSRRVNALDRILIPGLKEDIKRITQALEEMEREDMFRLRRIKKKRNKQSAM